MHQVRFLTRLLQTIKSQAIKFMFVPGRFLGAPLTSAGSTIEHSSCWSGLSSSRHASRILFARASHGSRSEAFMNRWASWIRLSKPITALWKSSDAWATRPANAGHSTASGISTTHAATMRPHLNRCCSLMNVPKPPMTRRAWPAPRTRWGSRTRGSARLTRQRNAWSRPSALARTSRSGCTAVTIRALPSWISSGGATCSSLTACCASDTTSAPLPSQSAARPAPCGL